MATTQLAPAPVFRSWDNNGNPLYAGQLFTYAAGTTTPQTTYTDSTGNTANTNPVILNSRGEANVWLNPSQAYKFVLEDSNSNLIWTVDQITSPIIQTPYGAASGTNAITVNTTPAFSAVTDGLQIQFKAANTTTALATLNANSTAPYNLYYSDGTTQIAAGAIIQNNIYTAIFDSSLNSSTGGWIITNPSRIIISATVTIATGLTTTPTGTLNAELGNDGHAVDFDFPAAITGTSNSAAMTLTGIPALISASRSMRIPFLFEDNTALLTGATASITTGTSTTWTCGVNLAGTGGFTTTGTKGIIANTAGHFVTG